MEKVWIVTTGSYSAYQIEAVFATEEEAKVFLGGADNEVDGHIEEWPLGEPDEGIYQMTYLLTLDLKSGNVITDEYMKPQQRFELHPRGWSQATVVPHSRRPYVFGRSVISADHALKVAAEKRQEFLRNGGAA